MGPVRLRQVALVAHLLGPAMGQIKSVLGAVDAFHDPGVSEFGLENAVFAIGDTFLEVVSPVRDGTTAGRYLMRRGGDAGYMAIFQVADVTEARRRIAIAGVRVVWQADLADMSGTHLHPRDVPGAIVSVDAASPPEAWHWAGPSWIGGAPAHSAGGITGITVGVQDPESAAARWAEVLGVVSENATIELAGGTQKIRFRAVDAAEAEGISDLSVSMPAAAGSATDENRICGVRVHISFL